MVSVLIKSIKVTLILAVILCGLYPLGVTVVGKVFFRDKVNGGIVYNDKGEAVGARLIGQSFSKPEYFHPRPSAAGQNGYDAANSSGSNLGPTNQKLLKAVQDNIQKTHTENGSIAPVPVDLVTASGSGLDPHISPLAAEYQSERIAKARGITLDAVKGVVLKYTAGRDFGILGEPTVNVLEVNLALDKLAPVHR